MEKRSIAAVSIAVIVLVSLFTIVAVPFISDDTDDEVFGYRIVGQNSDGLLSGEMTLSYGETPDGTGYLIEMNYSIATATNTQLSGQDYIVTSKETPWTDGGSTERLHLDTYWGPMPVDRVLIEGEGSVQERYVADGILYESVYTTDDVLVIAMLESSGLLGERTASPTQYSYTMEISGYRFTSGADDTSTAESITGAFSLERLDSTGTSYLIRTMQLIIVGDEVWVDDESLEWTAMGGDYASGECIGTETISSAWGDIEVEVVMNTDEEGCVTTYYSYGGTIPIKMTVLETDGSDLLFVSYDAVSYTFEGEVYDSLDELLPHSTEW